VAGPGQGPCLCTFGLAFELLENLALAWRWLGITKNGNIFS